MGGMIDLEKDVRATTKVNAAKEKEAAKVKEAAKAAAERIELVARQKLLWTLLVDQQSIRYIISKSLRTIKQQLEEVEAQLEENRKK